MIVSDNTMFRGMGRNQTRLEFGLPDSEVIVVPVGNLNVHRKSKIEVFFRSTNAEKVTIYYQSTTVGEANAKKFIRLPDAPGYMKAIFSAEQYINKSGAGPHFLRAEVSYQGGITRKAETRLVYNHEAAYGDSSAHSVISFVGRRSSDKTPLTKEAHRDDNKIMVTDGSNFKAGDYISISAPPTERWNNLIHNRCEWGEFREFVTLVEKINGNEITLLQPLRIDYPLTDKPQAKRFLPLKNSGISEMTITQLGDIQKELKMGAVIFCATANCRAEKLIVDRPGTQGVFGVMVKFCTISDCVFRNPWRTNLGGLAYCGWELGWDCLIERVETFRMRHAPLLNWSSSGNVIRDSTFHESDAQWHSGWCSDNLFEQCSIESTTCRYNGYGYGFFSTPTDDSMHGPNGPRNTVYNCRAASLYSAFYLGGMNRQWRLMYNFLTIDDGPGIIARLGCADNIIKGNVFVLKKKAPLIYYEFLDHCNDVIENNLIYGSNGKLWAGPGCPRVNKNNRFMPLCYQPPNSKPPVPSIYLWQKEQYPLPEVKW